MADPSKAGHTTTEHAAAQSAGKWGLAAAIVGILITIGSALSPALGGEDTVPGILAGAAVAIAGIVQTTLTKLSYINSRTAVKVEQIAAATPAQPPPYLPPGVTLPTPGNVGGVNGPQPPGSG